MGQFLKRLFLLGVIFFQTIGEATIWVLQLFIRLIVWVISITYSAYCHLQTRVSRLFIGLYRTLSQSYRRIRKYVASRKKRWHISIRMPTVTRAKKKKFKSKPLITKKIIWFSMGVAVASIGILIPVTYYVLLQELPNPRMLTVRSIPVTTKLFDRNGILLYEIYADQNRTPVPLEEIPDYFKNATIAVEDKGFYTHQGFSVEGITRAAYATFLKNDLQGGSTITQQLVRSALLTRDVTLKRKLKELALSIWSEQLYTKEEILEMYFNQVPYGGTAWGAEAAAQTYFGKSIRAVSLAEAALLAGLPAAPTTYSPFGAHPEHAVARQRLVLNRMEEDGYITTEQKTQALNEPLTFKQPSTGIKAPHFVMYVRDILAKKYGMRAVEQGGLRVTTTLDLSLQENVQDIVSQEVQKLHNLLVGNGASVVTDPNTGDILAMVGSIDYFDLARDGNVNVALTPQQPGSTIKVVTYAAALQHGFTAATLLNDSPITYDIPGSSPYSPVNYDGRFHGLTPLRYALGNSYNIPAVRALAKIGVPTMVEQGRTMGITSWDDSNYYGLSLALGGSEVTMLDMASVFGTLANNGVYQEISPILQVTDYLGNVIEDNTHKKGTQVVPESVSFIISDILSDNNARIASFGPNSTLSIPDHWVAVKTGTSNEKRDNWAIGYTKDFVVTAWVGNNDNSPMHPTLTSGITGATPIWRSVTDLMLARYPSAHNPVPPDSVVAIQCRGRIEYFIQGTEKDACRPIPLPNPSTTPSQIIGT
jgi:penicillin-binding protein 1C